MRRSLADPFTWSVIQAGLEAAAQEMFDTLRKTAMSPIIYEVLDVGTGVMDPEGKLVSSGAGIPGFIGVLDKSVKTLVSREGDKIAEGDVFVLNDPNFGGVTHLNDIVVAEPVFHEGRCVAWVASIAHWSDIGGQTPGSMAANATEIVAEGLRLPPVRLYRKGRRNRAVFDIIQTNSRLPDFVTGDLSAQIAAGRRGAATVRALHAKHGTKNVQAAIQSALSEGEARARAGLAALPKGRFEIKAHQDDGALWHAAIEIDKDMFTVDLRDAPTQSTGPHNTSRDGAMIVCQMLFKALTDAERFANAGSFAPLEVQTRPGTIFDPGPTSPQGYYFETRIRLFDLLWRCMAEAMPKQIPAGHFATIFGTVIAGVHPDTGRKFTMVEPQMGGWGATAERNGEGPLFSSSHGDTFNCPVEIAEARYGLEVIEKRLNAAALSGGHRIGGPGVVTRYRLLGPATLSVGLSHGVESVWSSGTSVPGGVNGLHVLQAGEAAQHFQFVSDYALETGDEIKIATAYGGMHA